MAKESKDRLLNFLKTFLKPSKRSSGTYIKFVLLGGAIYLSEIYTVRIEDTPYLTEVVQLFIIYLSLSIFFVVASQFIIFAYRKKNNRPENFVDNFTIGITKLSRFFFIFIFILVFVDVAIIDIVELITSLAIGAFLIGLVFKDYVINFLNGVYFMFSGKLRLGEYVKIGDTRGRIKDLTFNHVEMITDTKNIAYVPNTAAKGKEILNFTRSTVKNIYVEFTLAKEYYAHYKELKRQLEKRALKEYEDSLTGKEKVKIHARSIDKDKVTWEVEYIVSSFRFDLENELRLFTMQTVLDFINKIEAKKEKEKKDESEKKEV